MSKYKPIKVKVTQDHIDAAKFIRDQRAYEGFDLSDQECCPVALALKDAGFVDTFVNGYGEVFINQEYGHVDDVFSFVDRFDEEMSVKPFSFWVK